MPAVLVVGGGVIGLTVTIRLREAGIAADVVARDPPEATTAVAAALWYPYRAFPRERVAGWSARGFQVLSALAGEPGSGVPCGGGPSAWPTTRPTRGGATRSRRSRRRPAVRLEDEARGAATVVHCYGDGGAGVTLAWGCAEEVVRLTKAVVG